MAGYPDQSYLDFVLELHLDLLFTAMILIDAEL